MAYKIHKTSHKGLRKITIRHHSLENKQPQWLRKFKVKMEH